MFTSVHTPCNEYMNFSQSELKSKMIEAKFQEEKLRLQQKHDDTVQKVGRDTISFLSQHHYIFAHARFSCFRFWIERIARLRI